MRMSSILLASGAFAAFSSLASAADISSPVYKAPSSFSPAPVYSWTGFYAGVHGGYGWSRLKDEGAGGGTANLDGWLGGLQVGYNYQMGRFVIGAEADYSWADVKRELLNQLGTGDRITNKNDYFATAALRLGYAFDRTLIYAKGGGAWTRDKADAIDGVGGFGSGSFSRSGWVVGAGVEHAFWNNVSAKLEYNFLSFSSITELPTTGGGLVAIPVNASLNTHLLKFGLNYKFF